MKSFNTILKRASERKGGDDSLFGMLPTSVSQQDYPVNRREQLRRYGMFAELG